MNGEENIFIVQVYNEKELFDFYFDKNFSIEEIKIKYKEKCNYLNEEINNINLWFIDDDNDKNLFNKDIDLITNANEIESSKYFIKLNVNINKKIKEAYKNEFEKKEEKNNERQIIIIIIIKMI